MLCVSSLRTSSASPSASSSHHHHLSSSAITLYYQQYMAAFHCFQAHLLPAPIVSQCRSRLPAHLDQARLIGGGGVSLVRASLARARRRSLRCARLPLIGYLGHVEFLSLLSATERRRALRLVVKDTYAASSWGPNKSKLRTITKYLACFGLTLVPFTVRVIRALGAALKWRKYQAADQYLYAARAIAERRN